MTISTQSSTPNGKPHILFWGRYGNKGQGYSRDRVVLENMQALGWRVSYFHPAVSALGYWQALFSKIPNVDAVWVPCFRHRDLKPASQWAARKSIPVIFDPLISAYDKRVFERQKYPENSAKAKRVLAWEQGLFKRASAIIADTEAHKTFFQETLNAAPDDTFVIPVCAEEHRFIEAPETPKTNPELLFYGSLIGLQGATYIVEAAKYYTGPKIKLTLLGAGPDRQKCEAIAKQTASETVDIQFEDWIDYEQLPQRIHQADICLGVFGIGKKSMRVIPNKVYQSLACGRPVITLDGFAYPEIPATMQNGLTLVPPGDPEAIAGAIYQQVKLWHEEHKDQGETKNTENSGHKKAGKQARLLYDRFFSSETTRNVLRNIQHKYMKSQ